MMLISHISHFFLGSLSAFRSRFFGFFPTMAPTKTQKELHSSRAAGLGLHHTLGSKNLPIALLIILSFMSCQEKNNLTIQVFETSKAGHLFQKIDTLSTVEALETIEFQINPEETYQTITGIGGSFTESTAHVLNQLSPDKRLEVIKAYFGDNGAKYSLTRTHIASCDFSLNNYTYAKIANDLALEHFTIQDDLDDLIPLIKDAQKISTEGFNIIASPWTAPPWMKDNNHWVGGQLLKEHYPTFSLYFQKYLEAYKQQGINIWGITPVNEPHGNGNNWESMHFSPHEMTDLVQNYLGPQLEKTGWQHVNILGYDQNRAGLKEWVDVMFATPQSSKYYAGTAVHWYESTYDYFPEALTYAHQKAPNKHLIQTEGCIDSQVPEWQNDLWYWSKEATDWGWDWASEDQKHLHPKYAPVHRYATDIIGCLNHHVDGWIDWNMVLDRQGGPNWFKNWCGAPVIVDTDNNQVYYTPLYYVMKHFSRFIRPNSVRIGFENNHPEVMSTAVKNPDGSVVLFVFNPTDKAYNLNIKLTNQTTQLVIDAEALQTIVLK